MFHLNPVTIVQKKNFTSDKMLLYLLKCSCILLNLNYDF